MEVSFATSEATRNTYVFGCVHLSRGLGSLAQLLMALVRRSQVGGPSNQIIVEALEYIRSTSELPPGSPTRQLELSLSDLALTTPPRLQSRLGQL